jgi:hypothetical protein
MEKDKLKPEELRAGFYEIVDRFKLDISNYLISAGLNQHAVIMNIERDNWKVGLFSEKNKGYLGDTSFILPLPHDWGTRE